MQKAIFEGRVNVQDIGLINSHATSTQVGDLAEGIAIRELFKDLPSGYNKCLVTANKGNIGHTFGAAGAIESIFTILSIKNGVCPKILNLEKFTLEEGNFKFAQDKNIE